MALIIEDGSLIANANSYVDVSYVDTFNTTYAYNTTWSSLSAIQKESSILRAMRYIENLNFLGYRVDNDRTVQYLSFPRTNIILSDRRVINAENGYYYFGYTVPSDSIPTQIKEATSYVALLESTEANIMFPEVNSDNYIKKKKLDVLETEWFKGRQHIIDTKRPIILGMLKGFLYTPAKTLVRG